MIFEGSYYPTSKMKPCAETPEKAKEINEGFDYSCRYCKKYGICFTTNDGDIMVVKPCSICAMNNGGVWGWTENEDGTYEKIKTNGMLPGNDSITDVILSHTATPPRREYEPLMEEIILGYIQYGLYFHLKWEDIMDFKEGASKYHGRTSNSFYRMGNGDAWQWWKLIRLGGIKSVHPCWDEAEDVFNSELPKRFCKVLKEILSNIGIQFHFGVETWDDFWKTEIDPITLAFVYKYVMKRVLDRHVDRNSYYNTYGEPVSEGAYKCEDYGVIDYVSTSFEQMSIHTVPYCERGITWIFDHVDPEYYGNPTFPLCNPREFAEHFYVSYFKDVDGRFKYVHEVLEIHEHDIFGTSLNLIINEKHDWFTHEGICTILTYISNIPQVLNRRWSTLKTYMNDEINTDISLEQYIHHSTLCQLTYQCENTLNVQRESLNYSINDYNLEYEFRVNFAIDNRWKFPINLVEHESVEPMQDGSTIEYEVDTGSLDWDEAGEPDDSDINLDYSEGGSTASAPVLEYENDGEGDDIELNGEKKVKIRDKLMEFQDIIENDVKDKIKEGTYLKIMDKLKEVYTELF